MKISIRKGVGFGLTSGIITTLGLIVGLNSGTGSRLVIIAGILTIAIADAFSDSLGIHISEESGQKNKSHKEIWESTISTFFSKLIIALSFLIPILLFTLRQAIIMSIFWGFLLITLFSYYIARIKRSSSQKIIIEHLLIATFVILATHFVGTWIAVIFT
jgi:VIT1/CCC1 family predicted Fe2+/Mn2+ transporter